MKRVRSKGIAALMLLAAGVVLATSYVTVDGQRYGCANECMVSILPSGGWMIYDRDGGAIWPEPLETNEGPQP